MTSLVILIYNHLNGNRHFTKSMCDAATQNQNKILEPLEQSKKHELFMAKIALHSNSQTKLKPTSDHIPLQNNWPHELINSETNGEKDIACFGCVSEKAESSLE